MSRYGISIHYVNMGDTPEMHQERKTDRRVARLFAVNFALIIAAYYQVKPASRTLYITYLGTYSLPYLWIASTLLIGLLLPLFKRNAPYYPQANSFTTSYFCFILFLLSFRYLLSEPTPSRVVAFYILVDAFSVILVENLWSLVNSVFQATNGKRLYGLITSGGLIGGALGAGVASAALSLHTLETIDLLLVAVVLTASAAIVGKITASQEPLKSVLLQPKTVSTKPAEKVQFRRIRERKYVAMLAILLLMSQIVQPIVEYQFLTTVERTISDLRDRTIYLSWFFGVLSAIALSVNLIITPWVYRFFGVITGLLVQPIAVLVASFGFYSYPVLGTAAFLKIADKGCSYSINRSSKELLYRPLGTETIYMVKAVIDMFGYRLFKIAGSLFILLLTVYWNVAPTQLGWLVGALCLIWLEVIRRLSNTYKEYRLSPAEATHGCQDAHSTAPSSG